MGIKMEYSIARRNHIPVLFRISSTLCVWVSKDQTGNVELQENFGERLRHHAWPSQRGRWKANTCCLFVDALWASCVSADSLVNHVSSVWRNQRAWELLTCELCVWSGRANPCLCWFGRSVWESDSVWNAAKAHDLHASTIKPFYRCLQRESDEKCALYISHFAFTSAVHLESF